MAFEEFRKIKVLCSCHIISDCACFFWSEKRYKESPKWIQSIHCIAQYWVMGIYVTVDEDEQAKNGRSLVRSYVNLEKRWCNWFHTCAALEYIKWCSTCTAIWWITPKRLETCQFRIRLPINSLAIHIKRTYSELPSRRKPLVQETVILIEMQQRSDGHRISVTKWSSLWCVRYRRVLRCMVEGHGEV